MSSARPPLYVTGGGFWFCGGVLVHCSRSGMVFFPLLLSEIRIEGDNDVAVQIL